jgi:predicted Zn-dependent peptidase
VVVGDVEPQQVLDIARRVLPKDSGELIERDYGAEEPTEAARAYAEERMEVSMPSFLVGFKCPPQHGGEEQHRFAAIGELACDVLMGESSPLYARLYSQGLINGSFGAAFDILPGAAYAYAGGDSKDARRAAAEIQREAERLAAEGIDEDYYQRVRRASFGSNLRGLNSFENIAVTLTEGYFHGYDPFRFPQVFDSITKEDVAAFLRRNLTAERAVLSEIVPREN